MNLDRFHCLHVILCVCNLANMIITIEGKALADTFTDGYDQRLASHYHVKEGIDVTMQVKSQISLHRNTNVHKYRNNNYKLTRWMYKQHRLMMSTYFRYEKVDEKNGNNKLDESVWPENGGPIDKQRRLLLLHYPVTYTRIKRDLSRIKKQSTETNTHNLDIMTRGKGNALPDELKPQQRRLRNISARSMKETKVREDVMFDLLTKEMQLSSTYTPRNAVAFKKNPIPYQRGARIPCVGCSQQFTPVPDEADNKDDSLPELNLAIVPLGAILIFLVIFCFKTFHWIVYDIRERDEKSFQMFPRRNVHPRKRSIFITNQSSTSSSEFGGSGESHSKLGTRSVQPHKSNLEYIAASGLLPDIPKSKRPRPGLSISYESEICPKDTGGTSPVTSACVAAAMTANIPMAIAFTMRQISNEKRRDSVKNISDVLRVPPLDRSSSRKSRKSINSLSPKIYINDTSAESMFSDVIMDHSSPSESYALPKPTWQTKQQSSSAYNDNCDVHQSLISSSELSAANADKRRYNTKLRHQEVSCKTSLNHVTLSDISDFEHSVPSSPSSPLSSSHTSIISSLSDTSVSIRASSRERSSDHCAIHLDNHTFFQNDSSTEQRGLSKKGESEQLHYTTEDHLKTENKDCSNVLIGTYDINFQKTWMHYTPILNRYDNILTLAEVHKTPSEKIMEKSQNKTSMKSTTENCSSKSHSNLSNNQHGNSTIDDEELVSKLNDIVKENITPRNSGTNRTPYLNGQLHQDWVHGTNSTTLFDNLCNEETQV